jgi:Glycosyltransferase family 87
VSIKPIMAPLWLWLVLTRRRRTAALAVMIGIVVNAVSWTVLGWHELGAWLRLLSLQGSLRDGTGYSLIALAKHLGLAPQIGVALMVGFGCGLAAIAAISIMAGRELRAFGAAVLLTIVVSPQIDSHYFALLLVPLALTRPRLSWQWLLPVALWLCPATRAESWQIVLWWALLGVLAREVLAARSAPAAREPGPAASVAIAA